MIKEIIKKDKKGNKKITYENNFYYRDKFTGKLIRKRKRGFSTRGAAKKFKDDFLFNLEGKVVLALALW